MARYECELSSETLKKAVAELNEPENNDERLAAIDKLRKRFQDEASDLHLMRTDDAFLLRFLRVKKFDQDRAFETLKNYHVHRKEWRDVFDYVDNPKLMKDFLSYGPIIPLSGRAINGTFVIIGRPGLGFQDNTCVLKFLAAVILTMEKLLENEEMQIHGVTIIEDMANFGVTAAMQMISNAQRFMQIMQEAMPIRVKGLNMVNEALVFDIIYAVGKQLMKEKLKKRLQVFGTEYKKLHEIIDPKFLPPSLEGTGPTLNAEAWQEKILSTVGEGEATSL